jgi:hypothetical protein
MSYGSYYGSPVDKVDARRLGLVHACDRCGWEGYADQFRGGLCEECSYGYTDDEGQAAEDEPEQVCRCGVAGVLDEEGVCEACRVAQANWALQGSVEEMPWSRLRAVESALHTLQDELMGRSAKCEVQLYVKATNLCLMVGELLSELRQQEGRQ